MDGLIPDEIIDRVRSGTDIVELVSEYVSLRKTGANYLGLCPFHQEKTPSFTVSPSKQIFHCFGCGAGGDAVRFVTRQENLSFPEAVRRLADRAGIIIPETNPAAGRNRDEYEALAKINQEALEFFVKALDSRDGARAREYLESREMAGEIAAKFSIGYSLPKWDGLLKHLEKKGVKPEMAEKAGLAIKKTGGGWYDRFRDRVIFPIRDIKGRVVGFGGRTMGEDLPKYLNSPETPLFHKGETLYAMDAAAEAIRKKGYSVIVEGYFDAIACHKAGVDNAVATMGTAMTQQHLRALKRQSKNVLLVFDSDPAGIKAAERTLDIFLGTDMVPKVALLPKGDDPDSLVRREGAAGLAKRLKASGKLLDFVIKRAAEGAETIEDKVAASLRITGILAKIENGVERSHYLKMAADELSVDESALAEELRKKTGRTGFYKGPEKPKRESLDRIEEGLLQVILKHPEAAQVVVSELVPEDFTSPALAEVARAIFGIVKEGGTVDVAKLICSLEDEQQKLVGRLALKEDMEDAEGFARGAVERFSQARHQKRFNELQVLIKQAEETKDYALLDKLQKEFLEWQKKTSWTK